MKTINDNLSLKQDTSLVYGYKSTTKVYEEGKLPICPNCLQTYNRCVGEIDYVYAGKIFCTWSCKSRYIKKHPNEEKKKIDRCEDHAKNSSSKVKQAILYEIYNIFPQVPKKLLYKLPLPTLKKILNERKLPDFLDEYNTN